MLARVLTTLPAVAGSRSARQGISTHLASPNGPIGGYTMLPCHRFTGYGADGAVLVSPRSKFAPRISIAADDTGNWSEEKTMSKNSIGDRWSQIGLSPTDGQAVGCGRGSMRGIGKCILIAAVLPLSCAKDFSCECDRKKDDEDRTESNSEEGVDPLLPEHFVCVSEIKRPVRVSAQTTLQRLNSKCKKRILKEGGKEACLAAAIAKGMSICKKDTSPRKKACRKMKEPATKIWLQSLREDVLGDLTLTDSYSSFVTTIGNRVLEQVEGAPCSMEVKKFLVYEDSDVQALALPGGPIVLSTELLKRADESEVAFVIGHELGHVHWGSSDLMVLAQYIDNEDLLSQLGDVLDIAVSLCRGPLDESFVDTKGAFYAIKAGYDPTAASRVFTTLLADNRPMTDLKWEISHPPSAMRATDVWYNTKWYAKNKAKTKVFYRGNSKQVGPWDLSIPDVVAARCGS